MVCVPLRPDAILDYHCDIVPSALNDAGKPQVLLLGNGFAIDRDPAFRYGNLWQQVADGFPPRLRDVSARLNGNTNFEDILLFLRRVRETAQDYGVTGPTVLAHLEEDETALRAGLVQAIRRVHLDPPANITDPEIVSCALFLKEFDHIFTTNYDLLLYWMVLRGRRILNAGTAGAPRDYIDGFWTAGQGQPPPRGFDSALLAGAAHGLHYLHGALHLFEQDDRTWKRTAPPRGDGTLKESIVAAITGGQMPLIVTEGDWQSKAAKVEASPYLRLCHERLALVEGELVAFGFSFAEQDDHILQAIARNPGIKKVYVAVGLSNGRVPQRDIEALERLDRKRRELVASHPGAYSDLVIHFFDRRTACPWDSPYLDTPTRTVAEHWYWNRNSPPASSP